MKIFLCLFQKAACVYSPSVFGAARLQQYFFCVLRWKFLKSKTLCLITFFFFFSPHVFFRIGFREILPEKHVEYFHPWVYSFGYELVTHSTRLPLISGFYKLLSVTMKIAKRIKYFEVRSFTQWRGNLLY